MSLNENIITRGNAFPFNRLNLSQKTDRNRIVCAVSLFCGHCLELLPELKEIEDNHGVVLILVTNGTEDQNKIIQQEFGYQFKLVSYMEDFSEIGITGTPQAYLTDCSGNVVSHTEIGNLETLLTLWKEGEDHNDTGVLS